jgi:hypothetical protein
MIRKTPALRGRRGIVLTLDVAISMMVLLVAIATAYSYFGSPSRVDFESQLMRGYLQDAATVMANLDYLSAPITSGNGTNTTGIREVMRATPPSMCMQVSGYGTVVGRDLGGYWKFDEDSGVVVSDSSGEGHTGVIYNGGTLSGAGKSGHALTADGVDDYVDTGTYFPTLGPQFSFSLWAYPGAAQAEYADIFGNHGDFMGVVLQQDAGSTNSYLLAYGNGTAWTSTSAVQLNASRWQHIVAIKSEEYCYIYVNGALAANSSCATPMVPNPGLNFLIARGYASGRAYSGKIDDFRVYSRALTLDEVKLLYSNPSNILYVVDKPECAFSGAEVQSLTVPFAINTDQEENNYYYATFRSWLSGATK